MTNSPETITYSEICRIFDTTNCAARLVGCRIDLYHTERFDPPCCGFVEYRFEEHTSRDGMCVVQYDVYVPTIGSETKLIYSIEIDGAEFLALYDRPRPISG